MHFTLHNEDCLVALKKLADNSIHSVICDPPSGIAFLGKDWDNFSKSKNVALGGQSPANVDNKIFPKRGKPIRGWCEEDRKARENFIDFISAVFTEVYRVIKPGGFALIWALPRTSHWTATGIEDAGFELRDVIHHFFASGFPKSLNVGKFLKKQKKNPGQFEGFGTGLKPAAEHWLVARKPLSEKNVVDNVLKHGTGALNIDGCRQPLDKDDRLLKGGSYSGNRTGSNERSTFNGGNKVIEYTEPPGRWPANLVFSHDDGCEKVGTAKIKPLDGPRKTPVQEQADGLINFTKKPVGFQKSGYTNEDGTETVEEWKCVDGCPVKLLNEQGGIRKSGKDKTASRKSVSKYFKGEEHYSSGSNYGDSGYASRFFFCAKPGRKERNTGCEKLFWKVDSTRPSGYALITEEDWKVLAENKRERGNFHPTCKGLKLMKYLCRLITPPGGTILDPFMGSGTTGVAALQEGFKFIGIERDPDYYLIANSRISVVKI